MDTEPKPALRDALRSRDFRAMLGAYALSRAGDFLYNVALVVVVLERTGRPAYVSALIALKIAPYVLLTPFAGVLADRVDRVRLMVASDLVRAGCMAALAVAVAVRAPVVAVVAVATLAGVAGTPHLSAFTATLPTVLRERDLAGGNSLVAGVEYVAMVAGPAGAAALLVVGSDTVPFVLNAGSFVVSALLLSGVRRRGAVRAAQPDRSSAAATGVLAELRQGVDALRSDRNLLVLSLCLVAVAVAYGFELVYLVLVSDRLLGTGTAGVGLLEAAVGLGGVLGVGAAARLATSRRPRAVVAGIVLCSTLPLALLSVVDRPSVALALLLVEGGASVVLDVVLVTTMQRVVAPERLALVDGLLGALGTAGVLVGTLLAAPVLAVAGLRPALVLAGAVPAGLALLGLVSSRRLDTASRDVGQALAPAVDALHRSRAFFGLAQDRLERLAARAVEERVAAGTTVVRQGEPADAFFVLVDGVCSAAVDGSTVATMTAPDFFGEIGLLQRRARTATVVAVSDAVLLRVSAADFLDAVSARPAVTPLAAALDRRLATALPAGTDGRL